MTIRQNPPVGAPIWVDLMTSDREKSIAFYGALFGWAADAPDAEFGGYSNFRLGDEPVAGLMDTQEPSMPDVWSVYLAVDDAAATVARAQEAGAEVMVDAMAVGDLGVMAVIVDPGGAVIGMWQPGEHRGGVVATTGAPCHFELHTRDYDAVLPFYRDVFGWTLTPQADTPGFRYTLYDIRDGESAGVMDAAAMLPDGAPSCWGVYFAVDDVDATLTAAAELGGSTILPAEHTPYGVLAEAVDSTGARYKLRADS